MLVNELASRTSCSARMIRYYESQGLIVAERRANGYRDFDETCVDRVLRIRVLLTAGLTVDDVRPLLGCFGSDNELLACPALTRRVQAAARRLEQQEAELARARVTLLELLPDASAG